MTQPSSGDALHLGDLAIGVGFDLDENALKRTLARVESQTRLTVRVDIDRATLQGGAQAARVAQAEVTRATVEGARARTAAGQLERAAEREGRQLLRGRAATIALNARLSGQAAKEQQEAARAATSLAREQARQEREAATAAKAAHAEGMARLRERGQTEQLNARLRRDLERQAAAEAREALLQEREKQRALQGVIEGLRNQQVASRSLWQAGKQNGADLVAVQRDLQRRALEVADAVDKESAAYRRLTAVAASAQRTADSATGRITPGGFAAGVRSGIQGSGLFQQIAGAGVLGNTAQNLGIVAQGFTSAKTAAASFSGATNTAATAAGFLSAGVTALTLGLGTAGAGLYELGRVGLQQVGTLQAGFNVLKSNGVQDVAAFEGSVVALKNSLGLVGKALPTAGLVASAADIVKAGTTASDALVILGTSSKLAAAESIPLNDASAQLLKNVRQYGLAITETARVGDFIAKAGNLAAGSANDLSVGLGIVGTTGKQAKIEMYDLLGMLVELDNKGMNAADVGANGLRSAIAALGDPTEKARGILGDLGIALEDKVTGKARPAGDILVDLGERMRGMGIEFNRSTGELEGNGEALRTVSGIMDNRAAAAVLGLTGDWKGYGQEIQNASGYLSAYSEQQLQGIIPAQQRLKTAVSDTGLAFAKSFAGPLADFLDTTARPLVEQLGGIFDKLNGIKNLGEIRQFLTITAKDDATAQILKLLGAGVAGTLQLTGAVGAQVGKNVEANQAQFNDLIQKFTVAQLQGELVRNGLLERQFNPFKQLAQARDIEANLAKYQKLLAEALAKNAAAIGQATQKVTAPLTGMPAAGPALQPLPISGLNTADPTALMGADLSNATVKAAFQKTGNELADEVVQWCARWVKLTLQKANPNQASLLQKYFGGNANDIKATAKANNLLRTDLGALKPGNVVIYDDNHVGIYIGKTASGIQMVRGNNAYGVTQGREVVSTERLNSLGKVAGYVRLEDVPGFGGPATPPAPPADPNAKLRAQLAEGHRLLRQYQAALASGNEVWIAKAKTSVDAFLKTNKQAAAGLKDDLQKIEAGARKKRGGRAAANPSKLGQGYDRLQNQLADAETDRKRTDDGLAYARTLDTIAASAKRAAAEERARNGNSEKARALARLEADAVSKARAVREGASREQERATREAETLDKARLASQTALGKALAEGRASDARASLDQLKNSQAAELALAQDSAQKRAEVLKRTGPAIVAAEVQLTNLIRDQKVKEAQRVADEAGKVEGADLRAIEATRVETVRQAYREARTLRNRALAEQASTEAQAIRARNAEQKTLRAKYHAEARDLDVAEQQATLSRITELARRELDTFKGTQPQRIAFIKRQAQDEFNAREQVARAVRDKARAEATYAGGPNLQRNLNLADQTYRDTVAAAQGAQSEANRRALESQATAVRAAREEYAKLATSMREKINTGKVEQADLDTFRLGMEASAQAVRTAGVAGDRFVEGARASAEAVYQLALDTQIASGAFGDVADGFDRATRAGSQYTVSLERALELIPGSSEANRAYLQTLQELARDGKVSADTVEQVTQAIADQEAIATLTAEALSRLTGEAVDSAQALETAGDSAGALDTLTTALDGAMEAALRGEDAADAIGKLTDEINRLTADQAVTDTFNAFVAGLSGLIDEQVNQTVDYIATLSDPKLLAKAKAFLAELRSQLPTFPDPYAAGYVPGPQGFVNGGKTGSGVKLEAITQAQELQTRLELETDPAQLQGIMAEVAEFLASALGATLPDATRQGLQEGVEGAQTYIGIQQGVADATAQGIRDGALRGTGDAPPVPALPISQYDALIDRVYELGDALRDPVQLQGLTESLQASRQAGELTEEQLQNLLALAQDFAGYSVPPEFQATLSSVQERVQALSDDFDAGRITAQEFSAGLTLSADDLAELATQAEGLGNLKLAGMIRDFAASLRGLNPEIAVALKSLGKVQEVAGYVIQVAGAFGQFAAAMGEAEQDYDRFTGKKLQTPWKDLAANLQGVQKLAQTVATVATDVMKLITNPADIGAWVSLITTVVSSIADAIAGFKKAQAEVQQLKDDFAADNPFLRPEDYQKAFTRSRGFFADVFGGGPEVVNEIDRLGLTFAKTMQGAFADGIKSGLTDALQQGKFSLFKDKLHEQVYGGLLSGMVDVFLNEELLKNIIAPAIKAWSDALKTPDPNDDVAALAGIDAAVDQVDTAANRFYTDVYPKLKPIQDKWGVGPDKPDPAMPTPARELFGAAPEVQLGLSRIEVQFPAEALRGLTDFRDLVIPAQLALIADERLAFGEFRAFIAEARGTRGPPPLSGLAGSL